MVPQRVTGLVLALVLAGCASAAERARSTPTLTVRNQTTRFVKLYTADTPHSVPDRLGRLVIGETRTFRLRQNRPQLLVVVFPDGQRIARALPGHRIRAIDVVIENSRSYLSLSYRE